MTCIVGYKEKGCTWIGCDSFGSTDFFGTFYKNKKVFKINGTEFIIGYTSSFRMGQLLQYADGLFDEISLLKNEIDERYLVTSFIPKVKELFMDNNFGTEELGGCFLIGLKDKLYIVQDDFSILEGSDLYNSVGSGAFHALGSLYTTKDMGLDVKEKIRLALESAEYHQINVRRPFYIMNTKDSQILEIK